jgi:signal transduction histidine kinase
VNGDPGSTPLQDLEREELIARERQSTARLRILAEASRVFSVAGADLANLLQEIANQVMASVASTCSITLASPDGEWLDSAVVRARDPASELRLRQSTHNLRVARGQGISGSVFASGRSILVNSSDPDECASRAVPAVQGVMRELGICSMIAVPLMTSGRQLGAIIASRLLGEPPLTDDDLALLEDLSDRAALAIENARLYQLEREARARAEQMDRRKEEFVAMLGHELRNPLAAIRTGVQIMRELSPGDPGVVWAREMIARHLEQLTSLVGELADVSRINLGKIDLTMARVDLCSIASLALESSRLLMSNREHALRVDLPSTSIWVRGDAVRLVQVLSNLLDNAAKYTGSGGQISLTVASCRREGVITVADNGVGIPPDMLERIFDPFIQVEGSVELSMGGLGLGLTLVKRLIDMHGGSVQASSDGPGQGSRFVLRLPKAPHLALDDPPSAG